MPFAASLRGMRLGGTLCATQLVTASCLMVGAGVGALLGLAWGVTVGTAVAEAA